MSKQPQPNSLAAKYHLNQKKQRSGGQQDGMGHRKSIGDFLATSKSKNYQVAASEYEMEKMRREQSFKQQLAQTMVEDANSGANQGLLQGGPEVGAFYTANEHGEINLNAKFHEELENFKNDQLKDFEKLQAEAMPSEFDTFGIKRRICTVCLSQCPGYKPGTAMSRGNCESAGEFPTFCRNCSCPAHFHKIETEQLNFPEDLCRLITANNIQSQDLNFNCVVAAFLLTNEANQLGNINSVGELLVDEGMEIISQSRRHLTEDEAFFLRSRVLTTKEQNLIRATTGAFQGKASAEADIRRSGGQSSLTGGGNKQQERYNKEKLNSMKEVFMRKTETMLRRKTMADAIKITYDQPRAQTVAQSRSPERTGHPGQESSHELRVPQATSEHGGSQRTIKSALVHRKSSRSPNRVRKTVTYGDFHNEGGASEEDHNQSSYYEGSLDDFTPSEQLQRILYQQKACKPVKSKKQFKLKHHHNQKQDRKGGLNHHLFGKDENDEEHQIEFIVNTLQNDPLMKKFVQHEVLILVVSSSSVQNLTERIQETIKNSKMRMSHDLEMMYLSQNKVRAFEDCTQFAPNLFKLSKSIVIAEPIIDFHNFLNSRLGKGGMSSTSVVDHNLAVDSVTGGRLNQQYGETRGRSNTQTKMDASLLEKYDKKRATLISGSQAAAHQGHGHGTMSKRGSTAKSMRSTIMTKKKSTYVGGGNRTMSIKQRLTMSRRGSSFAGSTIGGSQGGGSIKSSSRRGTGLFKRRGTADGGSTLGEIEEEDDKDIQQEEWVKNARQIETDQLLAKQGKGPLVSQGHTWIQYNYGAMTDFFLYSGMDIQQAIEGADLSDPKAPAGIMGGKKPIIDFKAMPPQECNIFAIAKVGLPNIIFPNTLDVKMSNFENKDSYSEISSLYFPDNAKSQITVIVLRPMIVKNALNDLFVGILKANDFTIIKRKTRMLTKAEVAHMFQQEKMQEDNSALFFGLMLLGPAEIVVCSKVGAVSDAKTIFSGADPLGRRRVNQVKETKTNERNNVGSVDAMFEVAPFTSFSELIDLEDFIVRNSGLDKYKHKVDRDSEASAQSQFLYRARYQEIKREINILQRFFNVTAYCSPTIEQAQIDLCVYAPQLAKLEEVVMVLNPLYNTDVDAAIECLIRSGFNILQRAEVNMADTLPKQKESDIIETKAEELFNGRFQFYALEEAEDLIDFISHQKCHFFHLSKISADRELRAIYEASDLEFENLSTATGYSAPYTPMNIPYLFYFLDTEVEYEKGLEYIYTERYLKYTGSDFMQNKIPNTQIAHIIQGILLTTIGDKIKMLAMGDQGQIVQHKENPNARYMAQPLNCDISMKGQLKMEPQYTMRLSTSRYSTTESKSVQYVVESEHHGLYEVRFHRLAHLDENVRMTNAFQEAKNKFEQFQSQSLYYNEVNKIRSHVCPAYYRYKVHPFQSASERNEGLRRCYEIEESMGDPFIESISRMHAGYLKQIAHKMERQVQFGLTGGQSKQKSMPAYVFGYKLANMAKSLEAVRCHQNGLIKGAGRIIYDQAKKCLRGEDPKITQESYYNYDKKRFYDILAHLKKGWNFYLSVLETQLIEEKLIQILESLTFRYSRMPEFLTVIPDRLTTENIRICEKIKLLNEETMKENAEVSELAEQAKVKIDKSSVDESKAKDYERKANRLEDNADSFDIVSARTEANKLRVKARETRDNCKILLKEAAEINALVIEKTKQNDNKASRHKKFFESHDEQLIDPYRESNVFSKVGSVVKTLEHSLLSKLYDEELRRDGTSLIEQVNAEVSDAVSDKSCKDKESKEKPYSVVTEVAIADFGNIARRPKYQLIANILWLIDFTLRKSEERRSALFVGDRTNTRSTMDKVEEEYDDILDVLKQSIDQNFGNGEVHHALDVQNLNRGFETKFEKFMRDKTEKEEARLKYLQEQKTFKDRKMRATQTIQELIEADITDRVAKQRNYEREELNKLVNVRGLADQDGQKFQEELEKSKMRFGPYALKIATTYVEGQLYKKKHAGNAKQEDQEKISFVKMEMFLFSITEADRVVKQLHTMEDSMERLEIHLDTVIERQGQVTDKMRSAQNYDPKVARQNQIELDQVAKQIADVQSQIVILRQKISQKETELLLIFRESMQFDYFVEDVHFERQLQIQRGDQEKVQKMDDVYTVPLSTFWRPVELGEYVEDPEMIKTYTQKNSKTINNFDDNAIEQFRQFMPAHLINDAEGDHKHHERITSITKPVTVKNLRPIDTVVKRENLKFEKYESKNEILQQAALEANKIMLEEKASKRDYEPYIPHFRKETVKMRKTGMLAYFTRPLELLNDPRTDIGTITPIMQELSAVLVDCQDIPQSFRQDEMRKIINWRDILRAKMGDTTGGARMNQEDRIDLRNDLEGASEKFNVIVTNCM